MYFIFQFIFTIIFLFKEDEEENIIWNPISEQYTCQITSPKKEYKLKGLKKFIAYQITPTVCNYLFKYLDKIKI